VYGGGAADPDLLEAARCCEAAARAVGPDRETHLAEAARLIGWTKRAGPRKKPPQASVNERRLRAYEAGDTIARIAKREKITKEAVRKSLSRARKARNLA
jgi:hypothetical protein